MKDKPAAALAAVISLTVGLVAVLARIVWDSWLAAGLIVVFALVAVGIPHWLLTRRDRRRAARDVDAWIREADGQPYDREALRIALEEPDAPDADRWRQEQAPPTAEAWVRFRALLDERLRRRL